ncbi:DUF488 domain-containing protein [Actinomyces procaprae]|uniref:DUF488 domain-containing protein n=1 Tax=Actinomyces procaprae TaxID=2560010 RepID=UPI0023D943CE|nr:DUF488 domain-containing protein [Actinomyces procaprae]
MSDGGTREGPWTIWCLRCASTYGSTRMVGVRLTPVSRVKGFSKSRLRDRLEAEGFVYEHRPEPGNPKDNRPGYANPGTDEANRTHLRYFEQVLDSAKGTAAIDYLATLVDAGETVFILCFEHDQRCCHRAQVIDAAHQTCTPTTSTPHPQTRRTTEDHRTAVGRTAAAASPSHG